MRSLHERDHLTGRELQIVRLMADGFVYKEIATRLDISTKTVETHTVKIRRVLHARTCAHVVAICFRKKWLSDDTLGGA